MAVIPTPNLAQIADPYADDVFNNMWKSVYGFKDTARSDYLKDQYVPAKEVGADLEYLTNRYALDDMQNTYDMNLATSFYGAQDAAWNARDDAALYPTIRGLEDQYDVLSNTDNVLSAQETVAARQAAIEQRATNNDAATRIAAAPGNTPWDKAINAYTSSLDDAAASPQVQQVLYSNMVEILRRQLSILPPGTPEYAAVKQKLVTFGGFGVQAPAAAQGFNTRPLSAPLSDDNFVR